MQMTWRRGILALFLITFLMGLSGCRRTLKAPMAVSPEVEPLRAKYATLYPDDPLMDSIHASTLHRGMSPTQVYVAWGRPLHRFKTDAGQKWIYEFSEDPESQPKTIAHLFFEDDELLRWKVDRGYVYFLEPESGGSGADEFRDLPDLGSPK